MSTSKAIVDVREAKRFMMDCLVKVGTNREVAEAVADVLVGADERGHYSHGLNRLEMYVNDVKTKLCQPNSQPKILSETPATAWVDGQNGFGMVVGNFCMQLAIKKARQVGVGWVVAKGSNHYGMACWYTLQAMKEGLLGVTYTNTSPLMTPTRAKDSALGTNPLSVAAAGLDGDSYILDMATTAVAVGKIEVRMKEGRPLPHGWACDENGNITTDAKVAFKAGRLLPLGGAEETSGYKGYGLAMMVDIFCGILAGSAFGPKIRKWKAPASGPANLGQCFVAVDPNCFAPAFNERMSELMDYIRCMEPVNCEKPVLIPGDPERAQMEMTKERGGLAYHINQMKSSRQLAEVLGVEPMRRLPTFPPPFCPCSQNEAL